MIPKLKICGLTRREDLEAVVALQVDFAGLILTPRSKRFLSMEQAALLTRDLEKHQTKLVAVFEDPTSQEVEAALKTLPLDFIQFHGQESPAFVTSFHFPHIKAFSLAESSNIPDYDTPYILLDAMSAEKRGGSGKQLDFHRAQEIIETYSTKKFFLAGGLSDLNISRCLDITRPFALDISSGVEISPGVKDMAQIRSVMELIRSKTCAWN